MAIPLSPDLRNAALSLTDGFAELLDALVSGHVYRCNELPAPPPRPGVYLFADGEQVLHVGRTRDLQDRRRNQTGLGNGRDKATFAFKRAAAAARAELPELPIKREELERHEAFAPYFLAEKEYMRTLDFRCVEIEDEPRQAIFEICASIATGLPPELWRTH